MTALTAAPAPPAGMGRRIAGYAIDQVPVLLGAAVLVTLVLHPLAGGSVGDALGPLAAYGALAFAYAIGLWWWLATAGLSPGKRLLGMRAVSAGTGRPIGWGAAFLRQLVLGLVTGLTLGLGGLVLAAVAARDPRRRGWHDRAAGSVVVDRRAPVALPPPARPVAASAPGIVAVGLPAGAAAPPMATPPMTAPPMATPLMTTPPMTPSPVQAAPLPPSPPPLSPPAPAPAPVQAVPRSPVPRPAPPTGGGLISAVPGLVDDVPGIGPSASPAPPVLADDGPDDDDPELTRMPRRPATPRAWVLDVGGRRLEVQGTGLLGRDPQPRDGERIEHLVPVEDPQRSLSKTHLAFGVDADGFWVCDRGSTNGTAVRGPDGARRSCPPDTPVRVTTGSTVLLGDHEVTVSRR